MINLNEIEAQAREWSVTLSSGDVDQHTLIKFQAWREISPLHEQTFQNIDRIWQGLRSLEELRVYATPREAAKQSARSSNSHLSYRFRIWLYQRIQQPYLLAAGSAFSLVMVIGIIWLQLTHPPQDSIIVANHFNTAHAEVRDFKMDDGSTITLAPDSEIIVKYSKETRDVRLLRGQGLFNVIKNPERPFIVFTENTKTQVVGTIFTIKRTAQNINIAVKEGKVSVASSRSSDNNSKYLLPGQSIVASIKGDIGTISTIGIDTVGTWAEGRLTYEDSSLKEIIADTNLYYSQRILLGSEETGQLRIAISFNTDNIDQMLENLTQLHPISINRERPGVVVLTKK